MAYCEVDFVMSIFLKTSECRLEIFIPSRERAFLMPGGPPK